MTWWMALLIGGVLGYIRKPLWVALAVYTVFAMLDYLFLSATFGSNIIGFLILLVFTPLLFIGFILNLFITWLGHFLGVKLREWRENR